MVRGTKPIRVLICNKYALFRAGIQALFPHGGVIEIIGEAATAIQAIDSVQRLHPDVVLLDTTASELPGPEATRRMKAIDPRIKILVTSLDDDPASLIPRFLRAGAAGYVDKSDGALGLRSAIIHACRRGAHAA
jgi:two-component system nitrate/nitrite response regulator NarL